MGNFQTKTAVEDVELITQHATDLFRTLGDAVDSAEVQLADFVDVKARLEAAQGADADDTTEIVKLVNKVGNRLDTRTKTWTAEQQTIFKAILDKITLPDAV